jgi:hypothetical protein
MGESVDRSPIQEFTHFAVRTSKARQNFSLSFGGQRFAFAHPTNRVLFPEIFKVARHYRAHQNWMVTFASLYWEAVREHHFVISNGA